MLILSAPQYTFGHWVDILRHEHIIHTNYINIVDALIFELFIGLDVRRDVSIARRSERAWNADLYVYPKFFIRNDHGKKTDKPRTMIFFPVKTKGDVLSGASSLIS